MILNNQIWKQTIATALVAVTGKRDWIRAIERAVIEIEKSAYWSFADGVLTLKSLTSGKLYVITAEHNCDATENGHKACKHRAARQLMLRYSERLALSELACETQSACRPSGRASYATKQIARTVGGKAVANV